MEMEPSGTSIVVRHPMFSRLRKELMEHAKSKKTKEGTFLDEIPDESAADSLKCEYNAHLEAADEKFVHEIQTGQAFVKTEIDKSPEFWNSLEFTLSHNSIEDDDEANNADDEMSGMYDIENFMQWSKVVLFRTKKAIGNVDLSDLNEVTKKVGNFKLGGKGKK